MSIQLIVFPQSYDGQFNSMSYISGEFIVDGINFNTINISGSYDSSAASVIVDTLTNAAPSVVNSWYRFRSTSSGTPTLPTEVTNNLTLYSATTLTLSGVYQRLSNLVVGTTYEMVIDLSTTGAGSVLTGAFNGTTLISQPAHLANQSQITFSWTAASTDDTIVISYYNTTADNIVISNISVSEQGITPTTIYTNLEDGQVICDLYEDEDIPLSISVDDFKNVAEKVQSYSKAFNLPATKRNNQIFDNIFEITRTDTGLNFNPYKRTKAILKQDGFLLFEGYLRLIDIQDKQAEISYNVNLYSEVVALSDVLAERTLSDLSFTELEHSYNLTNIQATWGVTGVTYSNPSTSGFRAADTVKYPFVDWNHQFSLGTNGNPVLPNLESAFRPFLNIKYLIDRIFVATDFTYESAFFDTADFGKLFMDFNWGGDNIPTAQNETYLARWRFNVSPSIPSNIGNNSFKEFHLIPETISPQQAPSELPPNYDAATNIITATTDNEIYDISYTFLFGKTSVTSETIECRWLHNSTPINQQTVLFPAPNTVRSYTGNFQIALQTGDTLSAQFKGDTDIRQNETFASSCVFVQSSSTISSSTLQVLRGELGQWDMLKGLMTMFNLVTIPDEDNPSNIKIEPYGDVFINNADSTELDWTDKIDVSEMKLTPLTELNKRTLFKFVEDEDDYAFMNYKNSVGGHLYGSKKYDASGLTILAGEDEIVAEPFAATVIKPLEGQFFDFITPAVYSYNPDDNTSKGFDNSPRIMYNNGEKTLSSCTYDIPAQNGVGGSSVEDEFLQFSHLTDIPTVVTNPPATTDTTDFHFGECQLMQGVGDATVNNLFNFYWAPYYNELYNSDTRTMTIKVNLSPSDISEFNFYDTVMIKNRTYRVNKIDYKPNDLATVEFILIP